MVHSSEKYDQGKYSTCWYHLLPGAAEGAPYREYAIEPQQLTYFKNFSNVHL
jgi:hypothetical protein